MKGPVSQLRGGPLPFKRQAIERKTSYGFRLIASEQPRREPPLHSPKRTSARGARPGWEREEEAEPTGRKPYHTDGD